MTRLTWPWLAIAACAGLAAWNPPWPGRAAALDVLLAIDRSASVGRAGATLAGALDQTLTGLPDGSRVQRFTFADRPDLPGNPAAAGATDLAAALDHALQQHDPARPAQLLLVSDGLATRPGTPDALRRAAAAGVPVYLVAAGAMEPPAPARLAALEVAAAGMPGAVAPIAVQVAVLQAGTYLLELVAADGQRNRQPIEAARDTFARAELRIVVPAEALAFEVRLRQPDGRLLDRLAGRVRAVLPATTAYLAQHPERPLAAALEGGGMPLHRSVPERAPRTPLAWAEHPLVILDDLPAAALDAAQWAALERAVTDLGTGLLVLGGPHSFAGGGYRGSALEALLPVLSEPARPQPATAVEFVVDTSGSMDRDGGGVSRLALARQALVESARGLGRDDPVGLITFAATPRELLPLARYDDPASAIDGAWESAASGGTQAQAALALALDRLAASPVAQRLLVLLTDGRLGDAPLEPLRRRADTLGVRLLAIAIGADAATARLGELALASDILRVGTFAELPRLLRRAVDTARLPAVVGPVTPQATGRLPWPVAGPWPVLEAYQVTRLRERAERHLAAPGGAPLLATWQAGSGRVAALPGGLAEWAAAWPAWVGWSDFAGGLAAWTARATHPGLAGARLLPAARGNELQLDLVDPDDRWSQTARLAISLVDAGGQAHRLTAEAHAPGRYSVPLPALPPGPVTVATAYGVLELQHGDAAERLPDAAARAALDAWLERGWLRPWPDPGALPAGFLPVAPAGLRLPLTGAALLLLLAHLAPWRRAAASGSQASGEPANPMEHLGDEYRHAA